MMSRLGAAAALACAGCASIYADERTFEGTQWRITAIDEVRSPAYPVWFSGGYMRGNICNRFEAPFKASGDVLNLAGFMSTERGCSNPTSGHEEAAFAVLHRPMRLSWTSARRLTLSNSAGSITLERAR